MAAFDFTGSTVVVTGSSRGIGRRIGERFYEAGANVGQRRLLQHHGRRR